MSCSITYLWGILIFFLLHVVCEARLFTTPRDFVTTSNTQFVLNGSPFLFNGFNSYWMMNMATDPSERHKISEVFRDASAAGLTVCRTWAFNDGGNRPLQSSPGVYDETIFQALDFVISEARRYRIKLVLSLVNNYNDYGGRSQYVQWAKSAGVQVNNDDEFYTNRIIKNYYKHHVKRVLTRFNTITRMAYKDDSTIMAWELMNEPRCQTDTSGKTTHGWIQEMARYVKSIDNRHLLEIGMEGFYGDSTPRKERFNPGYQVGTDFVKSNRIREIDFATIHAYPDIWLKGQSDKSQQKWVNRWMQRHWRDAKMIIGKPLVFAEFGKSAKDPGYTLDGRNLFLNRVYNNMYRDTRTGGAFDGGMVWQVVAAGMESYYDGYEIVLPQNPSTTAVISAQSHRMTDLAAHSHLH